jgi:hypothetical protein
MTALVHHLEVAALLVPLVGLAAIVIGASFGIAWFARTPKGRR